MPEAPVIALVFFFSFCFVLFFLVALVRIDNKLAQVLKLLARMLDHQLRFAEEGERIAVEDEPARAETRTPDSPGQVTEYEHEHQERQRQQAEERVAQDARAVELRQRDAARKIEEEAHRVAALEERRAKAAAKEAERARREEDRHRIEAICPHCGACIRVLPATVENCGACGRPVKLKMQG